jgi:EmrB/QacA subfamily drug resistance transporter
LAEAIPEAQGSPVPTVDTRPHGNPFVALAIVLVAAFMILLDISIVNVAIPSIQRDIHATFSQVQWVIAGYALAYGVLLITGGRLGDIVGRKRMFIIGVAGFTVASALCGLSQSGLQLVAFRVLQGLMASMMYPQIFSIITIAFPPQRRPLALGLLGGVIGLATITGPLLGGILIQLNIANLDWRPIFLINVPVGAGAVIAAALYLQESRPPKAPTLDIPGVLIASTGLFLLTFPLVEGRDAGWPWWTFAMLAGAVVVMIGFFIYERRREAQGKDPLMVSRLFHHRSFVVGLLVFLVFFSGLPATFLTLSLFLQIGLGFSALKSGLTLIPFAVGSGLFSGLSIRLVPRLGRKVLNAGAAMASLGILATIFTIHQVGPSLNGTELIPALFVAGAGLGLMVAPSLNFIIAAIEPRDIGSASGVLTTVQQVGAALGIAIIGVIFFGLLSSNADGIADSLSQQMAQDLQQSGVPAPIATQVANGFKACFKDRSKESDPTVVPDSCQPPRATAPGATQTPPQVAQVIQATVADYANRGRAQDFTDTIQRSLFYNAGVFGLTFVLLFFLPSPKRPPPVIPGAGH